MSDSATQSGTTNPNPVAVPDDLFDLAFREAMRAVATATRKRPTYSDAFHDAAVDALMWARANCRDATTFIPFAARAVRTWLHRTVSRQAAKRDRRPGVVSLDEWHDHSGHETPGASDVADRVRRPMRPELVEGLPDDLGFLVRLYFLDGFDVREIGLLTGQSHNTVAEKLHRAAVLLHDGPAIEPRRRNGEKRLSAG